MVDNEPLTDRLRLWVGSVKQRCEIQYSEAYASDEVDARQREELKQGLRLGVGLVWSDLALALQGDAATDRPRPTACSCAGGRSPG